MLHEAKNTLCQHNYRLRCKGKSMEVLNTPEQEEQLGVKLV